MLAPLETAFIEYSAFGIALLLLALGLALLVYLRRQGGLELSLALMVASPSRRTVFLWGLCASLAALFGIGMTDSLEAVTGAGAAVADGVRTVLFVVGAGGILVLMGNAIRTSPPTLREGWNLNETAARVSLAAVPSVPTAKNGHDRPYPDVRRPGRPGK